MTTYRIIQSGESPSFPTSRPVVEPLTYHSFVEQASGSGLSCVFIGKDAGAAFAAAGKLDACPFVAIELGLECLGVHTGETRGSEGSNVVGFARFRLGKGEPTALVELVRQPHTSEESIAAAKRAFEAAGLKVAVCGDFPGRIVNRLIRPYLNAALRRLDEGLASADDMDKTLCLGLGYPEGPISLLERTGLAEHHDTSLYLYQALGQEPYAPARRAQVAKARVGH